MKKIALMLLVLTCSLAASAQQSIVSKRLDAFRNIDLSGNLHVELIKADSAHIDVKLNGTNSNRLDWGIKNGTLSVHLRRGREGGQRRCEDLLRYAVIAQNFCVERFRAGYVDAGYDRCRYDGGRNFRCRSPA